MKRVAYTTGALAARSVALGSVALGALAIGLFASSPARADFAVVKFESGYCRIWWDSAANPVGAGWMKVTVAPDWESAWRALGAAIRMGECR